MKGLLQVACLLMRTKDVNHVLECKPLRNFLHPHSVTGASQHSSSHTSPARNRFRNSVPDSFITFRPCSFADSAVTYSPDSVHTRLSDSTVLIPNSSEFSRAKSCGMIMVMMMLCMVGPSSALQHQHSGHVLCNTASHRSVIER